MRRVDADADETAAVAARRDDDATDRKATAAADRRPTEDIITICECAYL